VALVASLLFVLLTMLTLAALPRKLPMQTNALLFLAVSIVDINKFTIMAFTLRWFTISEEVPRFIAAVLHRDVTFTFGLLVFANAFLTESRRAPRLAAAAGVFLYLLATGQVLLQLGAIRYHQWNIGCEMLLILADMAVAYVFAKAFLAIARKEERGHAK